MTDILIIAITAIAAGAITMLFMANRKQPAPLESPAVGAWDEVVELKVQIAKLEQQIVDLERSKDEDAKKFEAVARDILDKAAEKSHSQLEKSHSQTLKQILEPVKEQFKGFQDKVDKYYAEDQQWRGALDKELKTLGELNMGLNEQAGNLARALKGDSKVQGDWGEYQLERILEDVGLTKGLHFSTQESETNESGERRRPDFIVNLPDGKVLIIDSKVSLTAYERYVNADNEIEQAENLKEHIQSMRTHIKGLAKKDYSSLYNKSVDYTLMFVPVEPAFFAAGAEIQSIQKEGLGSQVLLVSTSTIIATLRTISYIWRQEQQRSNVAEIANRGKLLYDKFVGFTKSMDNIGKHMKSADKAYVEAMAKLTTGSGNLVGQAEKLRKLGLNVKETVNPKFIEITDED